MGKNKRDQFIPSKTQKRKRIDLTIAIWDRLREDKVVSTAPTLFQIYEQLLVPWKEIKIIRLRDGTRYRVPKKLLR